MLYSLTPDLMDICVGTWGRGAYRFEINGNGSVGFVGSVMKDNNPVPIEQTKVCGSTQEARQELMRIMCRLKDYCYRG